MVDVKCLRDYELQHELRKLGFSPGPILPSTRKVYEKKLVQLLVSPPCTPPVMNGPEGLNGAQDDDGSNELNATIILKGNIILSSEKNKEPKKRLETSITKPKALDINCLVYKHSEGIRLPKRASNPRCRGWSTRETGDCPGNRSFEYGNLEMLPVGLKLAVLGIFIIVIFVYITVERKPFFG
ncbi:LEM domain-containing protein 1 isoform X2 [Mustela nigripes]|nr:LEM domain-containing protein 1 isoform X2 [Mustela lutreola]XP_059002772.1 LEM domain-containing protein 1 isoform X2 [Mustela lutreola]XP_059002773.1 LEM domain-containing protein 1 isoform X2 [Mustela lutreola]XP_059270073.1 LEM domain-containing protein 1 isoform X2 [Mustela nigripes]